MGKEKAGRPTITAVYEKNSKRYKRYSIGKNKLGIVGTIYVALDKEPPEGLELAFKSEED